MPARALGTALREGNFETEGWRVRKDGTRFWAQRGHRRDPQRGRRADRLRQGHPRHHGKARGGGRRSRGPTRPCSSRRSCRRWPADRRRRARLQQPANRASGGLDLSTDLPARRRQACSTGMRARSSAAPADPAAAGLRAQAALQPVTSPNQAVHQLAAMLRRPVGKDDRLRHRPDQRHAHGAWVDAPHSRRRCSTWWSTRATRCPAAASCDRPRRTWRSTTSPSLPPGDYVRVAWRNRRRHGAEVLARASSPSSPPSRSARAPAWG